MRLHRRIGEALEAGRRREPRRARLPLLREPRTSTAGPAFGYVAGRGRRRRRRARLRGGGRALPAGARWRPTTAAARCCSRSARAEERAGDPAARATFAAAAELARARGARDALAEAALGIRRPLRRGGRGRPRGDRAARGGAGRAGEGGASLLAVRLLARLADNLAVRRRGPGPTARAQRRGARAGARGSATRARCWSRWRAATRALLHIEHLDERLRLSAELLALAERAGERELAALGHHWRIYDLLEAAASTTPRRRARRAEHARRRAAPAAVPALRRRLGGRVGADGGPRRPTPSGSPASPTSSAGAPRRATPRPSTPPSCWSCAGARTRLQEYISTVEAHVAREPGARGLARGAAAGPPDGPATRQAGVAQFRELAPRRLRRRPARHVLVHRDRRCWPRPAR